MHPKRPYRSKNAAKLKNKIESVAADSIRMNHERKKQILI